MIRPSVGLEWYVPRAYNYGIKIAPSENGGVLVWQSRPRDIDREVLIQRFLYDGLKWTSGQQLHLRGRDDEHVAWDPSVVYLGSDRYFVTWSEKQTTDYTLFGRFIEVR